jgi:hypothetical protein
MVLKGHQWPFCDSISAMIDISRKAFRSKPGPFIRGQLDFLSRRRPRFRHRSHYHNMQNKDRNKAHADPKG